MAGEPPAYPGYKAPECNGCGLCCLTVPCEVSVQFKLWKAGKCRALRFAAGRYWCDVISNPRRVSVKLAKIPKDARIDAIGNAKGCDHRAAYSIREAAELLHTRNLADELAGVKYDSYPRSCVFHREDGTSWVIRIADPAKPPVMQQCVDGLPYGDEQTIEPLDPAD